MTQEETNKKLEEKPIELDRSYISLDPVQWLDIGNALMVASNQLEFATDVYTGDPMKKSSMTLAIYSAIDVLSQVHASSKDYMDDQKVSANAMLEHIHAQLTGLAQELYPLLNDDDKKLLAERKEKLAEDLNKEFTTRVFNEVSSNEEVVEKVGGTSSLEPIIEQAYGETYSELVDKSFGEVSQ